MADVEAGQIVTGNKVTRGGGAQPLARGRRGARGLAAAGRGCPGREPGLGPEQRQPGRDGGARLLGAAARPGAAAGGGGLRRDRGAPGPRPDPGAVLPARPPLAGPGRHLRRGPALLLRLPGGALGAPAARLPALAGRPGERGADPQRLPSVPAAAGRARQPHHGQAARGQRHPHGQRVHCPAPGAGETQHPDLPGGQPLPGLGDSVVAAAGGAGEPGREHHAVLPHRGPGLPALLLPGVHPAGGGRLHLHHHAAPGPLLHRGLLGAPEPHPLGAAGERAVRPGHRHRRLLHGHRDRPAPQIPQAQPHRVNSEWLETPKELGGDAPCSPNPSPFQPPSPWELWERQHGAETGHTHYTRGISVGTWCLSSGVPCSAPSSRAACPGADSDPQPVPGVAPRRGIGALSSLLRIKVYFLELSCLCPSVSGPLPTPP